MTLEFPTAAQESFEDRQRDQKRLEDDKKTAQANLEAFRILEEIRTAAEAARDEIKRKYPDLFEQHDERDIKTYLKNRKDAFLWRVYEEYSKNGTLDKDIEKYVNSLDRHEASEAKIRSVDSENDRTIVTAHGRILRSDAIAKSSNLEVQRRNLHARLIGKLQLLANAFDNAGLDKKWGNDINIARYNVQVWAERVRDHINSHYGGEGDSLTA